MISFTIDWVSGISVGVEFIKATRDNDSAIIIDIFIIRLIIEWI